MYIIFLFLGWSPDVKVWEVIFNKSGDFQEIKRVFELTGHTSGISDVAFDVDSSHMATVSKDGTWKLFDTKSKYYIHHYSTHFYVHYWT